MKLEEFIQAVSVMLEDADIAAELEMGLELRMTITASRFDVVALRPESVATDAGVDTSLRPSS